MGTVMVVEDSLTDLELLTLYLQKEGLLVVAARSGEDAQAQIQQQKLDLIILDVILPGQSGFELCRKIKSNPETKGIPIVMCSTKNSELDKQWGKMGGADAYVTKPVDRTLFLNTIFQLIRR
jgi:CheY-like chemotaxis protein